MPNWDIGLDIGSDGLRVCLPGHGVTERAPGVAIVRKTDGHLLAVGDDAHAMLGRTSAAFEPLRPISAGVVQHQDTLTAMLAAYITKHLPGARQIRALVAASPVLRPADRRALAGAALTAGATECTLIPAPVMMLAGAGEDITSARTWLVIDVGAGQISASLVSMGRVILCHGAPLGSEAIDSEIIRLMQVTHHLVVGPHTAQDIKLTLAGGSAGAELPPMRVTGRARASGLPETADVESSLAQSAAQPLIAQLKALIRRVLADMRPQHAADVLASGGLLTGGGAMLTGLPAQLGEGLPFTFRVATDPDGCVIRGLAAHMSTTNRLVLSGIETIKPGESA